MQGTGEHQSTGQKIASMIPGTEANKEKKALHEATGMGAGTKHQGAGIVDMMNTAGHHHEGDHRFDTHNAAMGLPSGGMDQHSGISNAAGTGTHMGQGMGHNTTGTGMGAHPGMGQHTTGTGMMGNTAGTTGMGTGMGHNTTGTGHHTHGVGAGTMGTGIAATGGLVGEPHPGRLGEHEHHTGTGIGHTGTHGTGVGHTGTHTGTGVGHTGAHTHGTGMADEEGHKEGMGTKIKKMIPGTEENKLKKEGLL